MLGLEGNLGRAPRTWFKPNIPGTENIKPHAPYERNEDFNGKTLGRVWQWNHNPDDTMWKLKGGKLQLHTMPAEQLMWARNTLTQRVIGPSSITTVELNVKNLKDGDVAGLGNINVPCSWTGIVKVEKTQYTPGRLCQYTERFMKQSVTQQPSTTYRIIGIAMDPIAKPDASKRFEIIMDKKHTISNIVTSNAQQLLAINAKATEATFPVRSFKPAPRPKALNPNDYMTEDILSAGSTAKMAELTAKEIYDIRDSRNQLSRGEADNLPKDGAQLKLMYENMNRQEQALSQLFYGTTTKDTTWTSLDCYPTKEGRSVLFRFSKHFGLVDCNDLSGTPYYITVTDLHTVAQPQLTEEERERSKDIGLRVSKPSKISVVVSGGNDDQTLGKYEMNAAQFGFVESLSGELFGKKQTSQILLDPLTGSVKEIKALAVE